MIEYTVKLRNPSGVVLSYSLPNASLAWAMSERCVGGLSMTIPGGEIDPAWITSDARVEVWRRVDGGVPWLLGGQWLIEKIVTSGNQQNISFNAVDFNTQMDRRIIDYPASTDDVANAYSDKSGAADNLIKAFVRENIGALATDTTRALADLTVAADATLAPTVQKQASRKNLLTTCQDIALDSLNKGTYLTWGWTFNENAFTFQTYINQLGINHGSTSNDTIVISIERGNLVDPVLTDDYSNERIVVKIGGSGNGADRAIGTATNATRLASSPFARKEYFTSGTSTDDTATLNAEASTKLAEFRPRRTLTGRIVETEELRFGVHINYGDVIVAEYAGRSFDCHLDTVSGNVIGGIEKQLTILFHGEEII